MVIIYNTVWFKHLKIEFITHGRAGKSFHSGLQALISKNPLIKGVFFANGCLFQNFLAMNPSFM